MFATEFAHIHKREAEEGAIGSDIGENFTSSTQGAAGKKRKCCKCRLTRGTAVLLIILKYLCIAAWGVGVYYGIECVGDLFDMVQTHLDPPETSRAYQA